MIILDHLSKSFAGKLVIDNISLKIKEGEITGLLGPNGAGKTTTLRMIAGVLPPSAGRILINDRDIKNDIGIKRVIGFLPENNPLYEDLTVEEYLDFWADIKQIPPHQKRAAIDFVVENCRLEEVFFRPVSELSKGFRQRVGFAQSILTKPDILILDEPTEGLDPNQRQDIAGLISRLGRKRTVIISSHVLSELAKIANRMIIIHKGKIVADETPENLKKMGRGTRIIEVEITGDGVDSQLKKLAGVVNVSEIRKNYFSVETTGKNDIREDIFKLAVKNGWTLLTLLTKEQALEDVFSQLTSN